VVVGLDDEIELGEHAGGVAFDGLVIIAGPAARTR
jgi:hypothetical protein